MKKQEAIFVVYLKLNINIMFFNKKYIGIPYQWMKLSGVQFSGHYVAIIFYVCRLISL